MVRTAYRLGIASKLEPNASIALGTSEVSPLELVSAYAPFANGGLAVVPHVIERIAAGNGKVLYARNDQPLGRIVDARYVAMMNEMLAQTLTIGTARKAELPGWPAAGKTGTSQDFRDAWFIGYTSHLVTGVWLGNDDGTPTKHVTGGFAAGGYLEPLHARSASGRAGRRPARPAGRRRALPAYSAAVRRAVHRRHGAAGADSAGRQPASLARRQSRRLAAR